MDTASSGPNQTRKAGAFEASLSGAVDGKGASTGGPRAVSAPSEVVASGNVEAVERVMAVREAAAASPARLVHLDLENADGAGTRLRLDLRGSNLDATIDLQDPASAELMRARVNELHRALARVGIDADSVRIQSARLPVDGMEALREVRAGVSEVFRAPTPEALGISKNESAGGRSHGESAAGRQDGSHTRNPSQHNRSKEERR
jgi:hypothetical protein